MIVYKTLLLYWIAVVNYGMTSQDEILRSLPVNEIIQKCGNCMMLLASVLPGQDDSCLTPALKYFGFTCEGDRATVSSNSLNVDYDHFFMINRSIYIYYEQ